MDNTMHHWFDVVFGALLASIIGSVAYVLSLFPVGLSGELIHGVFVIAFGVVSVTISHYWRKWLERRDQRSSLRLEEKREAD